MTPEAVKSDDNFWVIRHPGGQLLFETSSDNAAVPAWLVLHANPDIADWAQLAAQGYTLELVDKSTVRKTLGEDWHGAEHVILAACESLREGIGSRQ